MVTQREIGNAMGYGLCQVCVIRELTVTALISFANVMRCNVDMRQGTALLL